MKVTWVISYLLEWIRRFVECQKPFWVCDNYSNFLSALLRLVDCLFGGFPWESMLSYNLGFSSNGVGKTINPYRNIIDIPHGWAIMMGLLCLGFNYYAVVLWCSCWGTIVFWNQCFKQYYLLFLFYLRRTRLYFIRTLFSKVPQGMVPPLTWLCKIGYINW